MERNHQENRIPRSKQRDVTNKRTESQGQNSAMQLIKGTKSQVQTSGTQLTKGTKSQVQASAIQLTKRTESQVQPSTMQPPREPNPKFNPARYNHQENRNPISNQRNTTTKKIKRTPTRESFFIVRNKSIYGQPKPNSLWTSCPVNHVETY